MICVKVRERFDVSPAHVPGTTRAHFVPTRQQGIREAGQPYIRIPKRDRDNTTRKSPVIYIFVHVCKRNEKSERRSTCQVEKTSVFPRTF